MVDVDELRGWTFDVVLDHGHGIVLAPATDQVPAPYAYTAGRTLRKRPEIVVTGIEGEAAKQLLNELVAYDDLIGLQPGEHVKVHGVEMKIIEANPIPLHAAILSFGVITAVQALLPDAAGEYPDTLRGRTSAQPVLPAIPEDAWDPYDEED